MAIHKSIEKMKPQEQRISYRWELTISTASLFGFYGQVKFCGSSGILFHYRNLPNPRHFNFKKAPSKMMVARLLSLFEMVICFNCETFFFSKLRDPILNTFASNRESRCCRLPKAPVLVWPRSIRTGYFFPPHPGGQTDGRWEMLLLMMMKSVVFSSPYLEDPPKWGCSPCKWPKWFITGGY